MEFVSKMELKKRIVVFAILALLIGLAFLPLSENEPIRYINRDTGHVEIEKVVGENWLVWLYSNPIGKLSLHSLVKRKFVSDFYGGRMDSPKSAEKISSFVADYDIDLSIAKKQEFSSFNDFFTRELKPEERPVNRDSNVVVSPADGKVLAYANISKQDFIIKGYSFDLFEFLKDPDLAEKYQNGSMLLFRLCPVDYHRYHFPLSGTVSGSVKIEGDFYSVNPIAIKKLVEIFCMNKREYVSISTSDFGDVIMAEIGATMVGSIVQTYDDPNVLKGEEKGYFKFGGSSVLLLFEEGEIEIDEDLLANTRQGFETEVKMGERIAVRKSMH